LDLIFDALLFPGWNLKPHTSNFKQATSNLKPQTRNPKRVLMMPLISLMLTHLVKKRNNAEYGKCKQTHHAQGNSPTCTVIQGFYEHHKTQNGNQYGRNKEWNLHIEGNFWKMVIRYKTQK
jgi:hypothetical protein